MSELDALLAALAQSPNDDQPVLELADWLEERPETYPATLPPRLRSLCGREPYHVADNDRWHGSWMWQSHAVTWTRYPFQVHPQVFLGLVYLGRGHIFDVTRRLGSDSEDCRNIYFVSEQAARVCHGAARVNYVNDLVCSNRIYAPGGDL